MARLPNLGALSFREPGPEPEPTALGLGFGFEPEPWRALGPDTGPKFGECKGPPPKPYAKMPFEDDEAPKSSTFKQAKKATQAETEWLRGQYGTNWWDLGDADKTLKIQQARKALAFQFAPIIEKAVQDAQEAAKAKFYDDHAADFENGLPKISFIHEVKPYLNAHHAGWQTAPTKDDLIKAAKDAVRSEKQAKLDAMLADILAATEKATRERQIEELNYPDKKLNRKVRALLRHWFNRKGKSGENRKWHTKDSCGAETGVPKAMHAERVKWAKSVVTMEGYDPANPPRPPDALYLEDDVMPKDVPYLPDGVEAVSAAGGQWLWAFMRALEGADINKDGFAKEATMHTIAFAENYWTASWRDAQKLRLKDGYEDFIQSIDELSEIPGAKNVAYSYTQGSGKFNRYLLWPANKVGNDPTKIPAHGSGAGGAMGTMFAGDIGPPDALHRLYKLINRCPRLDFPAVFIRAVKSENGLPHNLGKKAPFPAPVVGKGYLNVTFMSTSQAPPNAYTSGMLASFFNKFEGCCMYAITAPAGSPVLPLVLGGAASSAFASEQEVVLPPGLVLVYQGVKPQKLDPKTIVDVHFYVALPPHPDTLKDANAQAQATLPAPP